MINKAVIHNYRSCLKTEVELHPELTVLIGANGVGKSNILRAIYSFTKIERTTSLIPKLLNDELSFLAPIIELELTTDENKKYHLKANFLIEEDERNEDLVKSTVVKYKYDNEPTDYELMNFDLLEESYYYHGSNQENFPYQDYSEKIKQTLPIINSFRSISYYSASRFMNPQKCPISIETNKIIYGVERKMDDHSDFLKSLYKTFKNDSTLFEQYLFLVGKEGLNLVEDIDFSVQNIPNQNGRTRVIVTPTVKVEESNLLFNQLSDGTFRALALIFYILSDENQVLLIEEPEISVHHGLLLSIMELIKQESKRKQIIISTHSDLILDKVTPENVLLVTKDRDRGTLAKPLTKSMSENDYEVLKEYLETEGNLGEYWRSTGWEYE